ncbi:MAG: hypothetical protein A2Y12_15325 [Planctomycetes bacterium GWF2_42_9]|nr:MAG: hypothetical protein A2Y12_15325 [Planctomycetes bacterium GWF2_42_9]HAL44312.1 hypothetical protein [Phycisphaerales bacterium]
MKVIQGKYIFLMSVVLIIFSTVQADIVGLWRFDEGSGSDAADSSGYGNDAAFWAITSVQGKVGGVATNNTEPRWISHSGYGYAVELNTMPNGSYPDASNQNWNYIYTKTARPASVNNIGTKWTIAYWIKQYVNDPAINIGGGGGYQRVISCPKFEIELGVPTWMYDYFWPYGAVPAYGNADSWQREIGSTQATGTWYHYALVYDGTNLKRYINGAVDYDGTFTSTNKTLPNTWASWQYLKFGAQTDYDKDVFIGALDDIAFFDEALSASQIAAIQSGDFTGPWQKAIYETGSSPYVWDPTFIALKDTIKLSSGEKATAAANSYLPSFNWQMKGSLSDATYYGLANAGLWDGNSLSVEYAAFITIGDNLVQPKNGEYGIHPRIHKNTIYKFKTRLGGESAVGNIVGVKIYAADVNDPNNKTLITTLSQSIAANQTWYELQSTYTATEALYPADNKVFLAECFVEQGSGGARGTAFGWFDYVTINIDSYLTCEAKVRAEGASTGDLNADCKINFEDYTVVAQNWMATGIEPITYSNEMLVNSDFYADIDSVPSNADTAAGSPTGWAFVPATTDTAAAGIFNVDRNGLVGLWYSYESAGGSVAAYIDVNTVMQQTITSETIVNGQIYYLSATVGGTGGAYLGMIKATLEYVTNPTDAIGTQIAEVNFVNPENLTWRTITASYTGTAAAAGKYLRVKFSYGAPSLGGYVMTVDGYGVIGKASLSKTKPAVWPRANLLTNGDFEDYSSLPMGTNNEDGWLDLFSYVGHYTMNSIPGWDASSNDDYYYGLQCMLWAPAGQPAKGRVAAWFTESIAQKVTSETITAGQTYYVDYIASINASGYDGGWLEWPDDEPNMVVKVYWLAAGQSAPTGTEGTDWGLILSLQERLIGPIKGSYTYDVPFGNWVSPSASFTATSAMAGKSFYVEAYCNNANTPYPTYEEIFLSKEPRQAISAYTCYEYQNKYGGNIATDFNGDCETDFGDIDVLADVWLECNDPAGCN